MNVIEPSDMPAKVHMLCERIHNQYGVPTKTKHVGAGEYVVICFHPVTMEPFHNTTTTIFYNHNANEYGWCSGRLNPRILKDI